jgi:hypothetical protein
VHVPQGQLPAWAGEDEGASAWLGAARGVGVGAGDGVGLGSRCALASVTSLLTFHKRDLHLAHRLGTSNANQECEQTSQEQ